MAHAKAVTQIGGKETETCGQTSKESSLHVHARFGRPADTSWFSSRLMVTSRISKRWRARSGWNVDFAQLIKIYGSDPEAEKRYSPAKCLGCGVKHITGEPNPKHISTSYVERSKESPTRSTFQPATWSAPRRAQPEAHFNQLRGALQGEPNPKHISTSYVERSKESPTRSTFQPATWSAPRRAQPEAHFNQLRGALQGEPNPKHISTSYVERSKESPTRSTFQPATWSAPI